MTEPKLQPVSGEVFLDLLALAEDLHASLSLLHELWCYELFDAVMRQRSIPAGYVAKWSPGLGSYYEKAADYEDDDFYGPPSFTYQGRRETLTEDDLRKIGDLVCDSNHILDNAADLARELQNELRERTERLEQQGPRISMRGR